MPQSVHNSAVELAKPLFRRKRRRGNTVFSSSAGLQPFSIVGRRYSAGSSRQFSPFFSDRFERRGLVYVGSSIQHKTASDAVFAEYGFTWDAGNRITEFETIDGTAEYTYDKTGQLTGADYDYITDELYTYDSNGNRTNNGYVTGENNETLSDGTYRYSYDNEGNRTEKFLWTDTNNDGIIDASEKTLVQTYEWDYRNRLESVTNYENGVAKEVINYLYDYLNQMVGRSVTDLTTQGQTSEFYICSNGQIVLEFDTSSAIDVVKSINLWGANIDELVAVEQIAQNINDSNRILWTYGDHLNSIRDIAKYNTTTEELEIVNHLIYSAFGVLVSSTDGNSNNPTSISPLLKFRYTGKYFDDSTGLQNNINRWYDNNIGKWLSVDPIGFNGGDINLYRYVGNTTMFLDHNGLFTREDWDAIENMSEYDFRMFLVRHRFDPDYADIEYYYYQVIQPQNEIKYQIGLWQKRFSENLFDKPYWIINNEILEKERERLQFQELFLNNSFNDSSYLVNSPISQLRNLQFDTPYTPLVVNPYNESLVNQLNNYPSNNTGGNSPHSINDFNGSNNFAQQKYMAKVSPFNINMTQISIPSNLFTKGFKETVYDENYLKPGYMSYWIQSKYEIEPNISIFDKSYSAKRFNSDFKYINNSYVSSLEVQDFSMKPILGTNLGWESNMECQYGNMHIKTNVRMIYSPIISPFGIGKFYYGGQHENWSFTGTVYVSF